MNGIRNEVEGVPAKPGNHIVWSEGGRARVIELEELWRELVRSA